MAALTDASPTDVSPIGAEPSASRVRMICGLGNPGSKYENTRHNIGFRVIDELARRHDIRLGGETCRALSGGGRTGDGAEVLLIAPQTYMNRSGFTLRCFVERLTAKPADILVVYDEVHLPLGRLRLRGKGSPAGHRGLESIVTQLGTEAVPRLRIGVAEGEPPAGEELVSFVLGSFDPEQNEEIDAVITRAADACERWAAQGVEAAMQAFNG